MATINAVGSGMAILYCQRIDEHSRGAGFRERVNQYRYRIPAYP